MADVMRRTFGIRSEEGTWEAAFTAGSGTITVLAASSLMSYTRIGRVVHISGEVAVQSVSSPSGLLSITGLPYANSNIGEGASSVTIPLMCTDLEAATVGIPMARIDNGASVIYVFLFTGGTIANAAAMVKAGSTFRVGGSYFV